MELQGSVVYFIISHKLPTQVLRLIAKLRRERPNCFVVVHHDQSQSHLALAALAGDSRIHLLHPHIPSTWGGFSMIEIVRAGLAFLNSCQLDYSWVILLSGQDYPVRPLSQFENFLTTIGDGAITTELTDESILDRYTFMWYRLPRILERPIMHRLYSKLSRLNHRQRFLRFESGRVGCVVGIKPFRTPLPKGWRFYKGSTWWMLSKAATTEISDALTTRRYRSLVNWFRHRTILPDEAFIQTILFNNPKFRFSSDTQRYIHWSRPGAASPEVLTMSDLASIRESGKFFARKFDETIDATVLDEIDALT